jgi:hypothetical protein
MNLNQAWRWKGSTSDMVKHLQITNGDDIEDDASSSHSIMDG